MSYCPHCKTDNGPHFASPSFGEPGFYTCATADELFELLKTEYLERYECYAGGPKFEVAKAWLESHNIPLPKRLFV